MKANTKHSKLEPLEQRIAPAFTGALFVSTLGGDDGFKVTGDKDFEFLGESVSSAGDINGDGYDDLIIGAPGMQNGATTPGGAYVVFGKGTQGPATIDALSLNGQNGFRIIGENDGDEAGISVAGAGDVNGDGFDDVVVGAYKWGAADNGAAYVIFGHGGNFNPTLSLGSLNGDNGFAIGGANGNDFLGGSVSKAGDVNNDGFADVIIGAIGANGDATNSGAAFVALGHGGSFSPVLATTDLSGNKNGFKIGGIAANDFTGYSVGGGGDVNGDGYDDMVIGSSEADPNGGMSRGSAHVVYGKANFNTNVALSGLGTSGGFRINGQDDGDRAGAAVAIVGDINGDGLADVGVGAPNNVNGGDATGAGYVVFGKSGVTNTVSLSNLTGSNGFKLVGAGADDRMGTSIAGAGDVNGDGYDDLLVGSSRDNVGMEDRGGAYLLYGHNGDFQASKSVFSIVGNVGFKVYGANDGDFAGHSVSAAGDLNGDGYNDFLVGGKFADSGGNNQGAGYAIYGGPSGLPKSVKLSDDHKSATFFDEDGDLVTVKVSKGDLANASFTIFGDLTNEGNLAKLVLDSSFQGSDLSICAKPTASGGNGLVDIGFIDATGVDLGNVKVTGNVERIMVGNPNAPAMAMKSFTAQSLGQGVLPVHDTFGANYDSIVNGKMGTFTLKGDFNQADVHVQGDVAKLVIGGSLIGGDKSSTGVFYTTADQKIGSVKIGHDIVAGKGPNSGQLFGGYIGSVTVGGSLIGNDDFYSGRIAVGHKLGTVNIAHDVHNGIIIGGDRLDKVTIGGSLVRTDEGVQGAITARTIGSVLVKGDIVGTQDSLAGIHAGGPAVDAKSQVALSSVKVLGSVENAVITTGRTTTNGHSQIGKIDVGGDWVASSVAAGSLTSSNNYDHTNFANGDDALLPGGPVDVLSRIASIVIKGEISGTASGGDHFGFSAQEIGSLKVGTVKYKLTKGVKDSIALGNTNDFKLHEI